MTPSRFVPKSALSDGVITHAVQKQLLRWSQQWLSAPAAGTCSDLPGPEAIALLGCDGAAGTLWEDPAGTALAFLPQASVYRVAGACLGRAFSADRLNEADELFLGDLARAAVDDFVGSLSRTVSGWPELVKRDGLSMVSTVGSHRWFRIELGAAGGSFLLAAVDVVLAQVRVALARRAGLQTPLRPVLSAVLNHEVGIGAYAGRVRLNAGELSQLKVGDVLVLDHGADDPLVTTLNGRPIRGWRCDLDFPTPDAPSLKLGAPPEGVRA